jgi:hypothetical protein
MRREEFQPGGVLAQGQADAAARPLQPGILVGGQLELVRDGARFLQVAEHDLRQGGVRSEREILLFLAQGVGSLPPQGLGEFSEELFLQHVSPASPDSLLPTFL